MSSDDSRQRPDEPGGASREPAGSVGEEAAKLINALNDWAKEAGVGHAHAAASAASGVAAGLKNVDEHIATGSSECTYCPICQMISLVRQTSPEVRAHLGVAASSLLQAAAGLLETPVPADRSTARGVQKIDLDDAGDEAPWDEGEWDG